MQTHRYPELLGMIRAGILSPDKLIGKTIPLTESLEELTAMDSFRYTGIRVIDRLR